MFDSASAASVAHCLGEVVMDKVQRRQQHADSLLARFIVRYRRTLAAVHHRPRKSADRAASACRED